MSSPTAWDEVVSWLSTFQGFQCHVDQVDIPGAGKGLVATRDVEPDKPLLVIPPGALLNPLTLLSHPSNNIPPHLIPQPPTSHRSSKRPRISSTGTLNTTQLLTLHLALTRDKGGRFPSPWTVYLRTIPQDFTWHPLVWAVKGDKRLRMVPKGCQRAVGKVKGRFDIDLEILERVLAEEEIYKSQNVQISIDDFLWAWLIVNTRSVSLPLGFSGPTELYNHALVPILDLANHSSNPTIPRPRQIPHSLSSRIHLKPGPSIRPTSGIALGRGSGNAVGGRGPGVHLVPGRIAYSLVAPLEGFKKGEELRFEYHGMCNTEMWAEYGFAESPSSGPMDSSSSLGMGTKREAGDNMRQKGMDAKSGVIAPTVVDTTGLPSPPLTPDPVSNSSSRSYTLNPSNPSNPLNLPNPLKPSKPFNSPWTKSKYSGIPISHLIEPLWSAQPLEVQSRKESVLRTIGCWDNPMLHPYPQFEASHSTMMIFRVMHLTDVETEGGGGRKLGAVERWEVDYISEENERKVRESLRAICKALLDEVEGYRAEIQRKAQPKAGSEVGKGQGSEANGEDGGDGGDNGDNGGMEMVDVLWWEQEDIARGCLEVYSDP